MIFNHIRTEYINYLDFLLIASIWSSTFFFMPIFLKCKQTSLIIEYNYTTKQFYSFLHVQHLLTFLAKPFAITLTKHLKAVSKSTLFFLVLLEVGQPKINVLVGSFGAWWESLLQRDSYYSLKSWKQMSQPAFFYKGSNSINRVLMT